MLDLSLVHCVWSKNVDDTVEDALFGVVFPVDISSIRMAITILPAVVFPDCRLTIDISQAQIAQRFL